jgi:hypothetical protein
MKKVIEKILEKALSRFLDIVLNAFERMLQIDIDGDGTIGGKKEDKE